MYTALVFKDKQLTSHKWMSTVDRYNDSIWFRVIVYLLWNVLGKHSVFHQLNMLKYACWLTVPNDYELWLNRAVSGWFGPFRVVPADCWLALVTLGSSSGPITTKAAGIPPGTAQKGHCGQWADKYSSSCLFLARTWVEKGNSLETTYFVSQFERRFLPVSFQVPNINSKVL